MQWPNGEDYCEAVQNLRAVAGDEELRAGRPKCDTLGDPLLWAGGFAHVYRIECPGGNNWALKCFTREVADRQRRYREIAAHLKGAQLPFTVDFEYLERGLRIRGEWFPVVKMQWVEWKTLNRFVEESLDKPKMLKQLLSMWPKLTRMLREKQIGQADLAERRVRAIGDPCQRFAEDKLRLLRAVRFAATFDFTLDEESRTAIRAMAAEICVVSPERIAMEMRRMLVDPRRAAAVRMMLDTGLAAVVLPEIVSHDEPQRERFTQGLEVM